MHELKVHQIELEMQNETLRQTQVALEESRDRYLDLYEFSPIAYFTLAHNGLIAAANLTAATMLGVERQPLLKRRFESFVVAADRERWQRQFLYALKQENKQPMTLTLMTGDGSLRAVHLDCLRALDGAGQPSLRVALVDITERKRTELALAEKEAQYRAVIETAADGIWVVDDLGRLVVVNDSYARRSGYSREELQNMRIADLEVEESPEDIRVHMEMIKRDGGDLFETRHRAKNGEIWPVEINASYSASTGGLRTVFLRDITERKRAEALNLALNLDMEQVMRFHVARQTVAAIAHELNQPLNAITTYSDAALTLLRAGNPKPDRLLHALESTAQQVQRAGNVVRELLAFVSQGDVATAPLNLNDLVRTVIGRLAANYLHTAQAQLELEAALPPVQANPLQVEKVMANLVQNGIEAMRGAGIEARNITVSVRTNAEGRMAQVTVRDCGPGIDEQTLHRIFDPFFSTKPKGLGLGLAISRAIVEAHGGQLWVESIPRSGAAFHFTLPFVP